MFETMQLATPKITTTQYLVATGAVLFAQDANDPLDAIERVKERIRKRGSEHRANQRPISEPNISMSVVASLEKGSLNFIVMDESRSILLAGLFNGKYEQPVSRELAMSMRRMLSERLFHSTRVPQRY
jgi:hypothetical protein